MTARIANPSLRWLAAFGVACGVCTVAGGVVTSLWQGPVLSPLFVVTNVLPAVAIAMFVPFAILSFVLMVLKVWTLAGFAIRGAVIPLVMFVVLLALIETPGPNFYVGFVQWIGFGALSGAVFHRAWSRWS